MVRDVPSKADLIVFLEHAIGDARRQGNEQRMNDLLEKRGHIDELHAFLEIIAPYLGIRPAKT